MYGKWSSLPLYVFVICQVCMVVGTEMVGATRQLFVPMTITIKYYVNVVIFATVCFCYLSDMYGCGYRNGLCHKVAVCPLDNHHILHKNPAKTQGMHFVSVKHWNIETHKLYRKINFWRITKSKTSPKGSVVSVVSKLWNTLKMMKIAEHFSCFETNWNKPHFWCFEKFLKRTETWQKLTNVSVFLKRFETKLKQEENWLSPNVSVVSKQNWNKLWKR